MRIDRSIRLALLALFVFTSLASAQPAARSAPAALQMIEVAERGGQILSFRHLAGATVVELRGTKIEPQASARMKIQSRPGFLELDINRGDIKGLVPARRFGKDFLTYVVWGVSVDGAAMNLGEITFDQSGPISINITTPYQTFWLMVTAEPDFAVNDPSPVVVMYSINQDNIVTANKALAVPGKLIYYTYYSRYDTSPAALTQGVPNELLQARKAVELAAASGILAAPSPPGEEPLPDEVRTRQTLEQAREYLAQSESAFRAGGNTQETIQFARTAAQIAENARALALGAVGGIVVRQLERDLTHLRAELEQLRAEVARLSPENESLRKEIARLRERVQQLEAALAAEQRSSQEARARAEEAERKLLALAQQLNSLEEALERAQTENGLLRDERDKICAELRRQLASLGQLTQQGGSLVLTLASDILFDFNSFELRAGARENLAKLSVLRLLLFPQADVRYEGHTDLVGEDDYNQWLSEQRALAVYRYFLEESLAHPTDPAAGEADQQHLAAVQPLLAMNYAAARRTTAQRQQLLAALGDSVGGKGEREPVVNTSAAEERNRRVVLLFPPAQVGQLTALCEARATGTDSQR